MTEKLQKVLARAGLGSRRELEEWIAAGRVSVNGKIATLGDRVGEQDVIRVDGQVIGRARLAPVRRRVLMYHKPVGEVCTRSDPDGRPTVFANLPRINNGRWVTVGRLDINTSGLLLLTNDGELAFKLMHPSTQLEREYAVRVIGEVSDDKLERLRTGVTLEDGEAHFDQLVDAGGEGANHWYHVVLREGRNREVRRLWESQGATVSRLIRVRYGNVTLPRFLRPGQFTDLKDPGLAGLVQLAGLKPVEGDEAPKRGVARPRGEGRPAPREEKPAARTTPRSSKPAGRGAKPTTERAKPSADRAKPAARRRREKPGR
jgi:23S rRNA pseudouridine2605 synthase